MKICFIGHTNHQSTLSNLFFLEIIEKEARVEKYFFDEKNVHELKKLYTKKFDLVICYQYDFMALSFIARGFPVVVVPMYDGSENHSDAHWKLLNEARFVNFSYTLHHKCQQFNIDSFYAKYFPDPSKYKQVDYEQRKVFLWQRRPNHLNWRTVNNVILKDQFDTFHIHDSTDDKMLKGLIPTLREQERYNITVSSWFDKKSEMEDLLDKSNIYLAPRSTEGIGMAFLEAMARGMLVIANDKPTHNEYIANWINGVLYDMNNPVFVNLGRMEELGKRARETCFYGYRNWVNSIEGIRDFIYSCPRPKKKYSKLLLPIFDALPEVFFKSGGYNEKVNKIEKLLNYESNIIGILK